MGNPLMPPATSKVIRTNNIIIITENINLTKKQYEVFNIICNIYEQSTSQYLQEALVEAVSFAGNTAGFGHGIK